MKHHRLLLLLSLISCFFAIGEAANRNDCHLPACISDDHSPVGDSLPPQIETKLPKFPFEVLYVVTKEYETAEDGTGQKRWYKGKLLADYSKSEYVESRLADLYPKTTYQGLVEESGRFYDSVTMVYRAYSASDMQLALGGEQPHYLADGKDNIKTEFVSEENEIRLMQMTEEEVGRYENYNYLARKTGFATLEDILSVAGDEQNGLESIELPSWSFFSVVSSAGCSHLYYRMMLCKERAEAATKLYYLGCKSGMRGDAFRHIAVSMLLRHYLNETLSYIIMDVGHEKVASPNTNPCDTYMDLHNNRIGRSSMYRVFKDIVPSETSDWLSYLLGIKDFVDNDNNSALMEWDRRSSKNLVKKQRRSVGKKKYIYYDAGE